MTTQTHDKKEKTNETNKQQQQQNLFITVLPRAEFRYGPVGGVGNFLFSVLVWFVRLLNASIHSCLLACLFVCLLARLFCFEPNDTQSSIAIADTNKMDAWESGRIEDEVFRPTRSNKLQHYDDGWTTGLELDTRPHTVITDAVQSDVTFTRRHWPCRRISGWCTSGWELPAAKDTKICNDYTLNPSVNDYVQKEKEEKKDCLFVGWLLNVPATWECISGTDLLRQFYVLPHWDRNFRSNFLPHPVTIYWHRADQSQSWPYNARRLAR